MVLSQTLSVICRHHYHRSLVPSLLLQVRNKLPQRRIRVRDLAIVQPVLILGRKRLRRLVRIVRVIQMHPHKMRARRLSVQPLFRPLHYFHAPPLQSSPVHLVIQILGQVVVEIKAAVEARSYLLAVQHHGCDECGSVITLGLQQFRPCGMVGRQRDPKVSYAMIARQQSRQNRRMRNIGNRAGSEGLLEANPILRQAVQCRGPYLFIAVAMNMVGAQSVDGYQKDIRRGLLGARLRPNRRCQTA